MARTMRRRRKRFSRGAHEYLWTAVLFDPVAKDFGSADDYEILVDDDWSTSPANERCTLLRIVGYLQSAAAYTVTSPTFTTAPIGVPWCLYLTDNEEASLTHPAGEIGAYAEDVMQMGSYWPCPLNDGGTNPVFQSGMKGAALELDVRVKRKVTQAQKIVLSTGWSVGDARTTQLVGGECAIFRCLLQLK